MCGIIMLIYMYFTVLGWLHAEQDDGSITLNPSFTEEESSAYSSFDFGFIKGSGAVFNPPTIYYGSASEFCMNIQMLCVPMVTAYNECIANV